MPEASVAVLISAAKLGAFPFCETCPRQILSCFQQEIADI